MHRCRLQLGLFAAALGIAACGDTPTEPDPEPVRTVLFHQEDTGQSHLLTSDGRRLGSVAVPGSRNVSIGVAPIERIAAFVHDNVLALVNLDHPGTLDTILDPLPNVLSLASFSEDARFVAIVSYDPERAVIVYDRANHAVDTLAYGDRDAVLPPVFSPNGLQVAVITETVLDLFVTILTLNDPTRVQSAPTGFSRFQDFPIFGWPRWTSEGLLMAFVREGGDAPDTLLSARIDPLSPEGPLVERFRTILAPVSDERPKIAFGVRSTFAYSSDGEALVIGAVPGTGGTGRHALYLATARVGRVQLLLDDPTIVPILPNFVN